MPRFMRLPLRIRERAMASCVSHVHAAQAIQAQILAFQSEVCTRQTLAWHREAAMSRCWPARKAASYGAVHTGLPAVGSDGANLAGRLQEDLREHTTSTYCPQVHRSFVWKPSPNS